MVSIVGFIGLAGSGKTFEANKLVAKGYRKISFADALRDILFELTGVPENYDEFKAGYVIQSPLTNEIITGRQALQRLGSAIRANNPNYFLEALYGKVQCSIITEEDVVIDDIRYDNELELVKELIKDTNCGRIHFCNFNEVNPSIFDKHESNQLAIKYVKKGYDHMQTLFEIDIFSALYIPEVTKDTHWRGC